MRTDRKIVDTLEILMERQNCCFDADLLFLPSTDILVYLVLSYFISLIVIQNHNLSALFNEVIERYVKEGNFSQFFSMYSLVLLVFFIS